MDHNDPVFMPPTSVTVHDNTVKSDPVHFHKSWEAWAQAVAPGAGELRDVAINKLKECLRVNAVELDLSGCNLTDLPENFPPSVQILKVASNWLTKLPENLPPLLRELDISYNQFTHLLENLPHSLEVLHATANCLTKLPENLPPLLQELYIDHNQLDHLPENLPSSLEVINVAANYLQNLPIPLPKKLTVLDLSDNDFIRLPEEAIGLLCCIKYVDIANNNLSQQQIDDIVQGKYFFNHSGALMTFIIDH